MYHFEPAGEYLCARDTTRLTHVERAARRAARPASALLDELLAAPRVLLALPVHVAVQLERFATLALLRDTLRIKLTFEFRRLNT